MVTHLKTKLKKKNTTKNELEKPYGSIKSLENNSKLYIEDNDRLLCDLKRIGLHHREDYSKDILLEEQYREMKEFTSNSDIVVRTAYKNNTFVIMNTEDYHNKLNNLINDPGKFVKLTKDSSNDLKRTSTKFSQEVIQKQTRI